MGGVEPVQQALPAGRGDREQGDLPQPGDLPDRQGGGAADQRRLQGGARAGRLCP